MKLYLDDNRLPPPGYKLVRTVDDLKKFVKKYQDRIEAIDIDYDMGIYDKFGGNGEDFINWLEEMVLTGKIRLKKNIELKCHSSSIEGRRRIEETIKIIKAFLRSS
ncbi:cyclic-phosphate processing receiver domain-containing protein [Desulfurobacterium atlanticum]|uniref:Cyclic-phosphate processing Receiver domain-containing protein n=1 Tax=Desulfurobacterium atlanticum TaxID=240169 RepID=A0A238XVU9_9BACT|nr:cyclic-phosphate processing receiver domain-containing protein [Desulfurobacterium atlanticum]SNR62862.1 hypothetical protein SAMN06265340_101297 [Desulfurobacterium atlanticum]